MRSFIEILKDIRDTRCRLEEVPQNEHKEVSALISYGYVGVIEGYLFLTPLGWSCISLFHSTEEAEREAEELEKEVFALKRNFELKVKVISWIMVGLAVFAFLTVCIGSC